MDQMDGGVVGLPGSLLTRLARLVLTSPSLVRSVARMEWRGQIGIPLERRFRPGKSDSPTNVSVALTYRCNLRCVMCRQNRNAKTTQIPPPWYDPRRELSVEAWAGILEQIAPFRPWLYVTGGEPLLHGGFREFVREAKARKLLVHIQTNGTLLAEHAGFLVDQGVEFVTVSLDGPPEIHDAIRGRAGAFMALQDGCRTLVRAREERRRPGPVLSFNLTLSRGNLGSVRQTVGYAVQLEGDFFQVQHTMFNSPDRVARHNALFSPEFAQSTGLEMAFPSIGDGSYYRNALTAEDLPTLLSDLEAARRAARGRIRLHCLPNLPDRLIPPYYLDLDYPFTERCNSFWKTLRVEPDGSVAPCFNLMAGNLTQQSFREVWNGPRMGSIRRLFSRRLSPACARCCQRHFSAPGRAF